MSRNNHLQRKMFLILEHAGCLRQISSVDQHKAYLHENKWYDIDISTESTETILRDLHLLHAKQHTIKARLGDNGLRSEEIRKIIRIVTVSNSRLSSTQRA